ncbi:MAG TPA: hypothetical protein PLP27_00995 [Crocinitomicaceae bacterium]|nr:hypothetical protein [Crocinitomicaceae bacterium]
MKTTILFIFILLTTFSHQNCLAFNGDDKGNSKQISDKAIEKNREQKLKQDQKYLKQAKKQFWAMQSKQVKKTVKQTEKRNRINSAENGLMY